MSSFAPSLQLHAPVIQSYGAAGFKISGVEYASSILITHQAVKPLAITSLSEINFELFSSLAGEALEILLIGSGNTHGLLPEELRKQLRTQGLNPDVMSTGAACRTFNILVAEERKVAALLIKPEK